MIDYHRNSEVVHQGSTWIDQARLHGTVRRMTNRHTYIVEVTEVTEGRTSKSRSKKAARMLVNAIRDTVSPDSIILSDVRINRKSKNLSGEVVLTEVRTIAYAFGAVR